MTPEELARGIIRGLGLMVEPGRVEFVASYLRAAVEAENRACEALARKLTRSKGPKTNARLGGEHYRIASAASASSKSTAHSIADAIAARRKP